MLRITLWSCTRKDHLYSEVIPYYMKQPITHWNGFNLYIISSC